MARPVFLAEIARWTGKPAPEGSWASQVTPFPASGLAKQPAA
jgi:hypothetical protein